MTAVAHVAPVSSGRVASALRRGHAFADGASREDGERRQHRQDVPRLLPDRGGKEQRRGDGPGQQPDVVARRAPPALHQIRDAARGGSDPERRPRQQAAGDHRRVEPQRTLVVETRGGEAFEVVADHEAVDVGHAVARHHDGVPGQGDRGGDEGGGRHVRPAHARVAPFEPPRRCDGEERHDDGDGTLHQAPEPGRGAGEHPPAERLAGAAAGIEGRKHRDGRERDAEGQRQVGQRRPRHREVTEAGGRDRAGQPRVRARRLTAPRGGPHEQHQPGAGERRPQPRGAFARTGHQVGGGGEPVVEHRLLPAIFEVEPRRDPVARGDHLARGLGVVGLVGLGDRLVAETDAERDERQQQESENGPPHRQSL